MCFNATLTTPLETAQRIYSLQVERDLNYNRYNENLIGFTHPFIPVIYEKRKLDFAKWGLIPGWVKECKKAEDIQKYTLNARVETLEEKPSFKYSLNKGRVIVMFDGFYEWKHVGKEKIPYYISSDKPLIIAGLSSNWMGCDTFTLITTKALGVMKKIHNSKERMPFFIKEKDMDLWLDSSIAYSNVINRIEPEYRHLTPVQKGPNS